MGYLSDWADAEQAMEQARAACPDCDESVECPAEQHLLTCRRFRRERRENRQPEEEHL